MTNNHQKYEECSARAILTADDSMLLNQVMMAAILLMTSLLQYTWYLFIECPDWLKRKILCIFDTSHIISKYIIADGNRYWETPRKFNGSKEGFDADQIFLIFSLDYPKGLKIEHFNGCFQIILRYIWHTLLPMPRQAMSSQLEVLDFYDMSCSLGLRQ